VNLTHVGPLPPLPSGVADYGAALLPHLRPHFSRIVALVDGDADQVPPGLVDEVVPLDGAGGWRWAGRAVPLYQMGNHVRYHHATYRLLRMFPGVTVLHDGNLLPFTHELTMSRGDRAGFLREVGFERGGGGMAAAWGALARAEPLSPESYPLLARVARASLGVVVHSRCLRDRVLEVYPRARVAVIPHLDLMARDLPSASGAELKRALGFDPEGLLVGAFGYIAPSKRLDRALRAFARLRSAFPRARFVCVGEVVAGYDFGRVLEGLGLGEAVQVTGYVPRETFLRALGAVDVGVNLRYPTWGESSGALLRLMACGVPTVVTDAGAFSELPDGAVVKVPPGPDEVEALESALHDLLGSADRRAAVGAAAREFARGQCAPSSVARQVAGFVRALVGSGDRACASFT
jgi:glycosyltransferase involved in cell wall biosynthesis